MRAIMIIVAFLMTVLFACRSLDVVQDGGGSVDSSGRERGRVSVQASSVQPVLPKRLTRIQVLKAIHPHHSRVKDCGHLDSEIRGTVMVRFIVNGNGTVSESEVTGPYANTAIGDCIALKMYEIRFPQFSGPSFPIDFPFTL